ncbi:MAG: PepSY domain-containing protein [Planctomycetota bacterium]
MQSLTTTALLTLAALIPSTATRAPRPAAEAGHLDPRDVVTRAKLGLSDAIARALAAKPGRAVEADLEGEVDDDKVAIFFEIMIVATDGELFDVRVNAQDGAILSAAEADEDAHELPGFQRALRHTELDLGALVAKAAGIVKGTAFSASLAYEDGAPECEVRFVNQRWILEVTVEGRAGHVVELGMVPEHGAHAGDEHGEEGEEADEHGEEREHGEADERAEGEKHGESNERSEGEEHEEHEERGEGRRRGTAPKPVARVGLRR